MWGFKRKFVFLGREMIVTQHDDLDPSLGCEYADNNGKIREWWCLPQMAPILLGKP